MGTTRCACCGRKVRVRNDGKVTMHIDPSRLPRPRMNAKDAWNCATCEGGGKAPTGPVDRG